MNLNLDMKPEVKGQPLDAFAADSLVVASKKNNLQRKHLKLDTSKLVEDCPWTRAIP